MSDLSSKRAIQIIPADIEQYIVNFVNSYHFQEKGRVAEQQLKTIIHNYIHDIINKKQNKNC